MSNAEELKNLGNKAFTSGDFNTAIKHFTDAIQLTPDNHILFSNRSGAYASLKQFDKALEDANKCVKLKPDWAKGYGRLGAAYFGLDKLNEAEEAYNKGLELEPNNEQMKRGLQDTRSAKSNSGIQQIGKMFQSPELLQKIALSPKTRGYLAQQDFLDKLKMIKDNPSTIQMHLSDQRIMAVLAMMMGIDSMETDDPVNEPPKPEPPKSEPPKSEPPKSEPPKSEPPKSEPPKTETKKHEPEETKPEESNPNAEQAKIEKEKGSEFYKKREFEKALEHFNKAKELEPNNITHLTNIAAVYFEMNEHDKCIETCQKAVDVGRDVRADYNLLAKAFARMANSYMKKEDYEKAVNAYNKSLTEHRNPDIVKKLQEAQKLKEKKEKEAYINPKLSDEARERGNELFKKHMYAESVKEYTEAIKRNPSDARNYSNRSSSYAKLLAWNEALKDAEESIRVDPNFVKGYIKKANTEVSMKRFYDALKTLDIASKVDKDGAHASEIESIKYKCTSLFGESSNDEEVAERARKDPEIQEILMDPVMRNILEQMQSDPKALQEHMKNPIVSQKIQKLISAGVIRIGSR